MYETERIRQFLGDHWMAFQKILKTALDSPYAYLSSLDAYIFNKPGKQLRPALVLCTAGVCGTPGALSYAVAAVAEMIHTATLLHDDVADNAETRRGMRSIQKEFGPATAILLGDYWFARAFRILVDYDRLELLPLYAEAIQALSEGEILQLEKGRTLDISLNEYYSVCEKKTVSLFRTSMISGALSVPEKEISKTYMPIIEKAAYHLGMAFQINDDIMDYCPVEEVGKPCYQDIAESKITLPLLGALANAGEETYRPRVVEWIRQAENEDKEALLRIIDFVKKNDGLEYARKVWMHHNTKAQEQISTLPASQWRDCLLKISGM
ncbi:MAG: polyprenyl synthetase family protein [Bacteroidales bacterium]|nr:polyprenyl synthetase family protein [Bacteroidales bacterium]MDD3550138.1 polyprenyl synthetase family protein [Bacteroidales bacterium]MDD4500110.1 polyprenyl synthetase family protein [Bacteroidales bacterium]